MSRNEVVSARPPRWRRIRRWLARMGLLFDSSVPANPIAEADNPIHRGRARANGISNLA